MTVTPFFTSTHPWSIPEDSAEYEPTLLDHIVRLGQPYLPADEANEEVIRLTLENIRLQGELDRIKGLGEGRV